MKVYFYHTQDLNYIKKEWEAGRFPSHLLYGACELPGEGVEVVMHRHTDPKLPRWRRMLDVAWKILSCRENYDAVYATKQNGLDLIILLRALGLFRKPVIIWHHQPIMPKKSLLKHMVARLYYKGIDHMFMFSNNIVNASVASGLVTKKKLQQCPWGADLDFYDRLRENFKGMVSGEFISSGKELRDMPTLMDAFRQCPEHRLQIIAPADISGTSYEMQLKIAEKIPNIDVFINRTLWIPELAQKVMEHRFICICCQETNYTVGLTTLVEALALGMPLIISRNPNQPFEVSEEGCGLSVPYKDVEGWKNAIRSLAETPALAEQMGKKARLMAEETYNIRNATRIIATTLKTFAKA